MFYLGLMLAEDYRDSPIYLKGNSSLIMNVISNRFAQVPWRIRNIILHRCQVVLQNPQVSISYVVQDNNQSAYAIYNRYNI